MADMFDRWYLSGPLSVGSALNEATDDQSAWEGFGTVIGHEGRETLSLLDSRAALRDQGPNLNWFALSAAGNAIRLAALSARFTNTAGGEGGYLALYTKAPGQDVSEALRVTETGDVGIGTTTPRARVDVANGDVAWANSRLGADQGGALELGGPGTGYIDFHLLGPAQDYNVRIINDGDKRMTIHASPLAVRGNAGLLNLESEDHAYIQWYPQGVAAGRKAWIGYDGPGVSAFTIANESEGNALVLRDHVSVSGNLAIAGVLNKLDVAEGFEAVVRCSDFKLGSVSRRGEPGRAMVDDIFVAKDREIKRLVINYERDWSDVRIEGSFTSGSSREVKENIATLTSQTALEVLQGLTPVTFRFKSASSQELHAGFIAEEVPAIVGSIDGKGVNPMGVIATLTRVVQEQQRALTQISKQLARSSAAADVSDA